MEKTYYESKPTEKILTAWIFSGKTALFLFAYGFIFVYVYAAIYNARIADTGSFFFNLLIITAILISITIFYLSFLWRTYHYKITDKGVYFKGGIIVKRESFVPFFKITNVDVTQNIVEQMLGIYKLNFHTAGQSAARGGLQRPEIVFDGLEEVEKPKKLVYELIEKTRKSSKNDE